MAATVFSMQLQKLRKAKGVKQEQLAEHLGVSTQAVSKWENGSYPDGDLLPRIAKFFDVSIDYLYGNEQERLLELQWMGLGNGTVPKMAKEQGTFMNAYLPLPKLGKEEGHTGSGYIYPGHCLTESNCWIC